MPLRDCPGLPTSCCPGPSPAWGWCWC